VKLQEKICPFSLARRIQTSFRWRFLCPKVPIVQNLGLPLETLGSRYGKKTFVRLKKQKEKLVLLSGGVGEDISFDIDFAREFDCLTILIDPSTPALQHFQEVHKRFGQEKSKSYSMGSRQSVESYDLQNLQRESFIFLQKGLWNSSEDLEFFLPHDTSRDSSGSINGIHTLYRKNTASYSIKTTTVFEVLKSLQLDRVDILKLDIEGSALEVVSQMFADNIFPDQLLIEFDELHFPSFKSKRRGEKLFKILMRHGYVLVHRDSCDFTLIKKTDIATYR
jgi:FkbM family methyltransferase